MRLLLRKSAVYFAILTCAALLLRLFFALRYPSVYGDSFLYGDLAKNWLEHGILGTSQAAGIRPSLIRLPGYPAFLAAIWAIRGIEHYRAVLLVQVVIDTLTCFLICDLAWRGWRSARAAKVAFLLAALCPFTANYTACALPETLAIFFAALALDLAWRALDSDRLADWAACGAATSAGILVRPDGGILLAIMEIYLFLRYFVPLGLRPREPERDPCLRIAQARPWLQRATLLAAVALAPLVPWTLRNWHDFHVLQPLAPRFAKDPDQYAPLGFERWAKTWIVDYASVSEVYWPLDGDELDLTKVPRRAFDSSQEEQAVQGLFARYNETREWTPELDHDLDKIAEARIQRHPLRYYVLLPAVRIGDMWLRPRTEMLWQNDDRWWELKRHPLDSAVAMALGAVNLFYVGGALLGAGWLFRPARNQNQWQSARGQSNDTDSWFPPNISTTPTWGLLFGWVLARSLFLGTMGNPEPRYTLESYPVVILLAAALDTVVRGRGPAVSQKCAREQTGQAIGNR